MTSVSSCCCYCCCCRCCCFLCPAVWDSSIVVAKYLEKLGAVALRGKRCLDLSAGCGLVGEGQGSSTLFTPPLHAHASPMHMPRPCTRLAHAHASPMLKRRPCTPLAHAHRVCYFLQGLPDRLPGNDELLHSRIRPSKCLTTQHACSQPLLCCAVLLPGLVMAKLGAAVTVTDLAGNLPLLQHNCTANGAHDPIALTHIHTRPACLPEIVTSLVVVCPDTSARHTL